MIGEETGSHGVILVYQTNREMDVLYNQCAMHDTETVSYFFCSHQCWNEPSGRHPKQINDRIDGLVTLLFRPRHDTCKHMKLTSSWWTERRVIFQVLYLSWQGLARLENVGVPEQKSIVEAVSTSVKLSVRGHDGVFCNVRHSPECTFESPTSTWTGWYM